MAHKFFLGTIYNHYKFFGFVFLFLIIIYIYYKIETFNFLLTF